MPQVDDEKEDPARLNGAHESSEADTQINQSAEKDKSAENDDSAKLDESAENDDKTEMLTHKDNDGDDSNEKSNNSEMLKDKADNDLSNEKGDNSEQVNDEGDKDDGVSKDVQSEDSDTETFEDADVVIEENGVANKLREIITPDKDSTEDSEAFYDVGSDEEEKSKET